ncbi:MAG: hypothetical protein WBX38_16580 [Candidatus Sulfotelmatobacter sp.]
MTIADLKLIDASRSSWEHISEFRGDSGGQQKLRRFRLFAYENYSGKTRSFVEDDILTRLADYDSAVKKWGFDTVQGALNTILGSKISIATVGASVVSALFGHSAEALYSPLLAQRQWWARWQSN